MSLLVAISEASCYQFRHRSSCEKLELVRI